MLASAHTDRSRAERVWSDFGFVLLPKPRCGNFLTGSVVPAKPGGQRATSAVRRASCQKGRPILSIQQKDGLPPRTKALDWTRDGIMEGCR